MIQAYSMQVAVDTVSELAKEIKALEVGELETPSYNGALVTGLSLETLISFIALGVIGFLAMVALLCYFR